MAKVFGLPDGMEPPEFEQYLVDGRYDTNRHGEVVSEFLAALRQRVRDLGYEGELAGEVVRFPVADGFASYMVLSLRPAAIMHLPLDDGWAIPPAHARGLTAQDLRELVERARALDRLFGRGSRT